MATQEGTITANGQTDPIFMQTDFNLSLQDFGTATVALERSFDDGVTWGAIESFTGNTEKVGTSHEGALYRLNTTGYSSGTIRYRLSG